MNDIKKFISIVISVFVIICGASTFALASDSGDQFADDSIAKESRPFDFMDKYYGINGVEASYIFDRRDGTDKYSVFGTVNDRIHRGVRIIATAPAYSFDGSMVFWNLYGELFDESFRNDPAGKDAFEAANRFPIFIFPSATVKNTDRQAHMIDATKGYYEKNLLGLGVEVIVEYTHLASFREEPILIEMAKRNGISLDGTPIIRTTKELEDLTRRKLVTQTIKGLDDKSVPSYAIAPIIQNPDQGAIAPDAYLMMVLQKNGKPLPAETHFFENFECLQKTNSFCKK